MLPDRVSNPGPLTYESGALPIAPRSTDFGQKCSYITISKQMITRTIITVMNNVFHCCLTTICVWDKLANFTIF